ncbi:MAG: GNAT family N-acetyltransferase [Dermatophilaceae bacterium]
MADLAGRRLGTRPWRVDRAVTAVQMRSALLLPDGESLDAGRAIWTLSSTPLRAANGVIRYDATDFHGADSERDLDNCLAVLSTYDVPWQFSAWAHLGADLLVPQLAARGMTGTSTAEAMWLDLGGRPEPGAEDEGIDVRPAKTPSCHRAWTQIFTKVFGTPRNYCDVFEQMVARADSYGFVAYADGLPVGCVSMELERGIAVVKDIGVLPAARRRGVGRHLLEAANTAAAMRGATASVVVAERDGSALCTRLGYRAVTSVAYLTPAGQRS